MRGVVSGDGVAHGLAPSVSVSVKVRVSVSVSVTVRVNVSVSVSVSVSVRVRVSASYLTESQIFELGDEFATLVGSVRCV